MALYLVQHGLAYSTEVDPGRSLTPEGMDKVRLIAGVAAHYGIRVARIEHSGKRRAEQTALAIAEVLAAEIPVAARQDIGPNDTVASVAAGLDSVADLMLVGHLPFLERLVSLLTTGEEDFRLFRFQNGGIVCLDRQPDESRWHIKWTLMPTIG